MTSLREIECYYCRFLFPPEANDRCPYCKKAQPEDHCEMRLVPAFEGHFGWVAVRTDPDTKRARSVADTPPFQLNTPANNADWFARKMTKDLLQNGWLADGPAYNPDTFTKDPTGVRIRFRRPVVYWKNPGRG